MLNNNIYKLIKNAINTVSNDFPFPGYMDYSHDAYINISKVTLNLLPKNAKILDIGCGPADNIAVLQKLGFKCAGIDDLQDEWHKLGNNKKKILKFANDSGIEFKVYGKDDLNFKENSFDMIMSNDVIEHLHESPREFFNSYLKYLKPEGYVLVTVPNAVNIRKRLAVLRGKTNLPDYHTFYWSPGNWRGHIREYVWNDLYLLSKYLGLEVKKIKGCDQLIGRRLKGLKKIIFLIVTFFDSTLKDSLILIAKKPQDWAPKNAMPKDLYLKYLASKTKGGYTD